MKISLAGLKGDIFGGITAAVVALPLALAFGVASGAGAIAGLYGAIACGFFAAIFGGTPAQVSGPTGPMTVVMAAIVAQYADNLAQAFGIVVLGGVLQIVFGLARVGRFVAYTPYSVVSGFMSGIGAIIILIQTLPFVGLAAVSGGPVGAIGAWGRIPAEINAEALAVGAFALAVMIYWPRALQRWLPTPLAALIAGTVLARVVLTGAPIIGDVPTGLPSLVVPDLPLGDLTNIMQAAMVLALLGSIDSLLTSLVADSITRTRHNSDRELIGQGIGNIAAGLIGGLPGAGATMRTVINVRAGGATPVSGALHSLVLLALVLGLGPVAEQVPHAALAGILMKVGWDIVDWSYLKRIRRAPRDKVVVMLVTLGLTVFVDLITAVAVGLILAGFVTARWMEREELSRITRIALPEADDIRITPEDHDALTATGGRIELVLLRGSFSYASARQLADVIGQGHNQVEAIVLDFADAAHIDTSAAIAIEGLLELADDRLAIHIASLPATAERTLTGLGVLAQLPPERIHATRAEAIRAAAIGSVAR